MDAFYTDEEIKHIKWAKESLGTYITGRMADAIEREEYMEAAEWRDLYKFLQGGQTPTMMRSHVETVNRLIDLNNRQHRHGVVNNS